MTQGDPGAEADGRLDLVPLIDCVMLLLLFFILTSSFKADDMAISAILPPQGGGGDPPATRIEQPTVVRIAVLPGDAGAVRVRIGGQEIATLAPSALHQPPGPVPQAALDRLHAALEKRLADYEVVGTRREQPPVEVHCSSRLPWSCALAVFDGVRAYEQARLPRRDLPLDEQRGIAFAAPVVRSTRGDNAYDESRRLEALR